MSWEKRPKRGGWYWYQDQHTGVHSEKVWVEVDVAAPGLSITINYADGEIWEYDDILDDMPWFYGPIDEGAVSDPWATCPGYDGYVS